MVSLLVSLFLHNGRKFYVPELSNLSIFIAGTGIKPTEDSSVDLVYHYYLQYKASEDPGDAAIDADPTGQSRNLGKEIDLIIGYEEIRDVELALALGYFIPVRRLLGVRQGLLWKTGNSV